MINFKLDNIQQLSIEFNEFKKPLFFFDNVFEKINYNRIDIIAKKRVSINVSVNNKEKIVFIK